MISRLRQNCQLTAVWTDNLWSATLLVAIIGLLMVAAVSLPAAAAAQETTTTTTTTNHSNTSNGTYDNGASPAEGKEYLDFLCKKHKPGTNIEVQPGEPGYQNAVYSPFVYMLKRLVGAFMVLGPVGGTIISLYATVLGALQPGGGEDGNSGKYAKMRRNSFILGMSVPVVALGSEIVSDHILGYHIGCIIPDVIPT